MENPTPNLSQPLVSCLCVTRNKPERLKRAIDCFLAQTYPNKELLIVYEDDDINTIKFLEGYDDEALYGSMAMMEIAANPKSTLGELRNISMADCNGEYFCQWDDDDWYHADRLTISMNAIQSNLQDASILTNWLIFDDVKKQAYLSKFRLWEGSIFCKKSVINEKVCYPPLPRMEDSFFINFLLQACKVYPLTAPYLYIYTFHGNNTWPSSHFENLFSTSHPLSEGASKLIGDILSGKYSVAEGSARLQTDEFLNELNYLRLSKVNLTNEALLKWLNAK